MRTIILNFDQFPSYPNQTHALTKVSLHKITTRHCTFFVSAQVCRFQTTQTNTTDYHSTHIAYPKTTIFRTSFHTHNTTIHHIRNNSTFKPIVLGFFAPLCISRYSRIGIRAVFRTSSLSLPFVSCGRRTVGRCPSCVSQCAVCNCRNYRSCVAVCDAEASQDVCWCRRVVEVFGCSV